MILSIWHKIKHHRVWLNLLSWQLAFFFAINEENEVSKLLFIFLAEDSGAHFYVTLPRLKAKVQSVVV